MWSRKLGIDLTGSGSPDDQCCLLDTLTVHIQDLMRLRWAIQQGAVVQLLANQFALGPLTLVTSFAWNYTLLNKRSELGGKLRRDGLPTLQNGESLHIHTAPGVLPFALFPEPQIDVEKQQGAAM